MKTRVVDLGFASLFYANLAPMRHGPGDPTIRKKDGALHMGLRTPEGLGQIRFQPQEQRVSVTAWGDGADWLIEQSPALLGACDDPSGFAPMHPQIRRLNKVMPGLRIIRSGLVMQALVPAILEQKVTSIEAHHSYRRMVLQWGEAAPGPAGLMTPPSCEVLASLPYWRLHEIGVERKRADILISAASRASSLQKLALLAPEVATAALKSLHGVGVWTAAEVVRLSHGDPDAVSIGDYHLPNLVAWVLAGEPRADDERMLELLEGYLGQRARAVRLIELGGHRPPRFGPRKPIRRFEKS